MVLCEGRVDGGEESVEGGAWDVGDGVGGGLPAISLTCVFVKGVGESPVG